MTLPLSNKPLIWNDPATPIIGFLDLSTFFLRVSLDVSAIPVRKGCLPTESNDCEGRGFQELVRYIKAWEVLKNVREM
jgi:hypothetical protein